MACCYVVWTLLFVGGIPDILAVKRPHIIILLADDLGHDDVGFLGSVQIPTPNLDALAYDGIILDQFYVQRICTPSRAALMTGRHPTQLGLQQGVVMGAQRYGLSLNETLMPQYLKTLGYSTHAFGKWHLGFYAKEYTPMYRGFDTFYGFLNGREDYFDHTMRMGGTQGWGLDLRNNETIVKTEFGEYGTDIFTREAVEVIHKHDPDVPLFIYLPQQGVHAGNYLNNPLEAPWKYLRKFSHIKNKQRQIYAGMVSAVDESMGALTRALADKGMLQDSVIFFSTDNGGPAAGYGLNQACNWPLRGMKYTLWEGGVRGASFIWSPRLNTTGYVSKHRMQIEDMLPTLLHAAGFDISKLPQNIYGQNMWDMLSQNGPNQRDEIFHNSNPGVNVKAIRIGDMKLIISSKNGITAKNSGWYRPPEFGGDCQKYWINSTEGDEICVCDESEQWNVIPENKQSHEQYQLEQPDMSYFRSDIPHILEAIDRPKKKADPYIIKCGVAHPDKICNIAIEHCLFNITADPCEYNTLHDEYPQIVQNLVERLKFYESQAVHPRNKPDDPKGYPRYHDGIWGPWVDLSHNELQNMQRGIRGL